MNAKVMKEFVEQKQQGLIAEYAFTSVSSSHTAYLDFSNTPKFVSISLKISDYLFTINVPYSQEEATAWFAISNSTTSYCTVKFIGSSVYLSSLTNANYVEAVAFF